MPVLRRVAHRAGYDVDGTSPAEIVTMKREAIAATRAAYEQFWWEYVARPRDSTGVFGQRW